MAPYAILLLDTEPLTRNAYITLAIADALRRDPRVARVVVADHGDAIARFQTEGLDTFIAFGGARTHAPLLTRLAALAKLSILWTTEDPYEVDNNLRFSTAFDIVFTNERSVVEAYGGRAHHLPLAASPLFQDLPVLRDDARYRYDLLFIGTAWPNRVRSLNAILAKAPRQLKVKLALPYNEFIGKPALDDPSPLVDWRCGNADFARFANASRVVLTLPRAFSNASAARASGTTPPPRLFETALAGGFQVMVSAEPETGDYYADGSEVRLCADDDAALAAIAEALAEPERRIAMAEAARARTLAEHLYDHRVARMLDLAAGTPSARVAPPTLRSRKTVLYLTHNRAGRRPGGGVEVYQEVLTGLAPDYEPLFLFPVLTGGEYELRLEGRSVSETFAAAPATHHTLTDPGIEGIFEEILFRHAVDLVHVHHLLHLPLSLPLIAKACGVPVVYHLHDHYLVSERFLLLDRNGRFEDVVGRSRDERDASLLDAEGHPPGSGARRDLFMTQVVSAIDAFVTSTPFTGAYLRGYYPEIPAEKVVEIEMLTPGEAVTSPAEQTRSDWLTVAVVGNFAPHKGAETVLTLIRLTQDYPIRFKLFGHVDQRYRGRLVDLPSERVVQVGAYDQTNIVALLAGCDVSLHLSTWPETFVISLGEAWLAGLVPIVTDLGALPERVSDDVDGFVVPPDAPGAVMQRLLALHLDRERLARMKAAVRTKRFITKEAHLAATAALYARLIDAHPCPHDRVPDRTSADYSLTLFDAGIRVNARRWTSTGIAWDSHYPAALVSEATPEVEATRVSLEDALPPAHADLPETLFDLDRLTASSDWYLDRFRLDRQTIAGRPDGTVVLRDLSLRGWVRPVSGKAPEATYLRLSGPETTFYARLTREGRQDLVRGPEDWASAETGFTGRVAIAGLPSGLYAADLVQVVAGQRLASQDFFRVYLAPNAGVEHPSPWQPGWSGTVPSASGPVRAVRQNLPEAAGSLVALGSDVWAFEAETDLTEPGTVTALLIPAAGGAPHWLRAARQALPDGSRFAFAAAMETLEPGAYALRFVLGDGPDACLLTTETELVRAPGSARARLAALPPPGFRRFLAKRVKSGGSLDQARPDEADTGMIRCIGWAFQPGYGPPLTTVAAWREGGRHRYAISAAIARPDAAAHLSDPAASVSGYDLAVPEAALRTGGVRLYQCYASRTVEFGGFQAKVRAQLGIG